MELPKQLDCLDAMTSFSENNSINQKSNASQIDDKIDGFSFKNQLNHSLAQDLEVPTQISESGPFNFSNDDVAPKVLPGDNPGKKIKNSNSDELNQMNGWNLVQTENAGIFNIMAPIAGLASEPLHHDSAFSPEISTKLESAMKAGGNELGQHRAEEFNAISNLQASDFSGSAMGLALTHPMLKTKHDANDVPLFDLTSAEKTTQSNSGFDLKQVNTESLLNNKEAVFSDLSKMTNSLIQQSFQKMNASIPNSDPTYEVAFKDRIQTTAMPQAQTLVTTIQEGDSVLHTAFLKIYPPELGPVIAKIKMNANNETELSLLTSNAQTRDILMSNIHSIKENFFQSDMLLHKVDVEYQSDFLQQGSQSKDQQQEKFLNMKLDPDLFEKTDKKSKTKSTSINSSVIDAYL